MVDTVVEGRVDLNRAWLQFVLKIFQKSLGFTLNPILALEMPPPLPHSTFNPYCHAIERGQETAELNVNCLVAE